MTVTGIPLTPAALQVLRDIDRKNLDWWATHRIDLLMRAYLAEPRDVAAPRPAAGFPQSAVGPNSRDRRAAG